MVCSDFMTYEKEIIFKLLYRQKFGKNSIFPNSESDWMQSLDAAICILYAAYCMHQVQSIQSVEHELLKYLLNYRKFACSKKVG